MFKKSYNFSFGKSLRLHFAPSLLAAWLAIAPLPTIGVSSAADGCAVQFAGLAEPSWKIGSFRAIPENEFTRNTTFPAKHKSAIATAAKKYGVNELNSNKWRDVINDVYKSILDMPGKTDLEKGELMAQFAANLDQNVIRTLKKETRKSVNYMFALAVNRLEEIPLKKYKVVPSSKMPFDPSAENIVGFNRLYDYTKRYLHNDLSFIHGNIIGRDEIRVMQMQNLFPAYIQHDMIHVHFATGHPRTIAAFHSTARSQNDIRYAMTAAAYEAVDDVQYSEETAIAKYLSQKYKFDIEEGITYLSRATNEELERIMEAIGHKESFLSNIKPYKNWKPPTTSLESIPEYTKSIDQMVDDLMKLRASSDPEVQRLLRFSREPNLGGANWGTPANHEEKNF